MCDSFSSSRRTTDCLGELMERAVPILPGDDIAVAKAYYVDKLGFATRFLVSDDGKQGLLGLERGSMYLTIDCPMSGHGRDACVGLEVENADALYEEWKDRVPIKQPPKNEEWGARTFGMIDPFGNSIFVMGPLRS